MRLVIQNPLAEAQVVAQICSSTEHLKAPTGAKSKLWKYFGFAMNEAGVKVRHEWSVLFVNMTSGSVEMRQI